MPPLSQPLFDLDRTTTRNNAWPALVALLLFLWASGTYAAIPAVTSSTTATATVGSPFHYAIYGNNTASSYNATPLPAGLSLDSVNGIISGTPTTAGSSAITISAINSSGPGSATLNLTVSTPGSTYVETYPGPGVNTYLSSRYTVQVYNGSSWLSSYTYAYSRKSVTAWNQNATPTVNFTTFGTVGPVVVQITKTSGSITSVDITPKSKAIAASISNGAAFLTLNQYDKVWITINGDNANPLFVFASPPKPAVPPGATYFGPGVTPIAPTNSNHYQASTNEVIYLDGGAWVQGNISVTGTSGVQIMGPGVLSGDLWTSETVNPLPFAQFVAYSMIIGDGPGNSCSVQGITIVDSPGYNIRYITRATDVKILSPWYWSTDGFYTLHADQCFAFAGDNIFFPLWYYGGSENVTVTNSFGGATNNSVIAAGYWGFATSNYATLMDNVDIKTYGGAGSVNVPSVFQAWMDNASSTFGYKNKTFQNIRIEGNQTGALLQLENKVYPWSSGYANPPLGNATNFVFKNIAVSGTQSSLSAILGQDASDTWQNVTFQDWTMNATLVTSANQTSYLTTNSYVSGLTFSTAGNKTITASSGVGGIISPAGPVALSPASNQTFLFTPAPGYALTNVTVDGTAQGAAASYTFNNITAAHTITATFAPLVTFTQWETQYPTLTDLAAANTPQHDGVTTLQKYLFDLNPTRPVTIADRPALPLMGTTTIAGTPSLTLTYRQNPLSTALTLSVQTTPDLVNWTTITNPAITQVGTDPTTGDPMMQVTVPSSGTRQFIRLNVISH